MSEMIGEAGRSGSSRLETVTSYREHLERIWGIRYAEDEVEVLRSLSAKDRAELAEFRRAIAKKQAKASRRLYRWMATPARLAAVHSLKWSEILSSGVWAAWALERFARRGHVLDLGANAGYWTTWVASRRDGDVRGIDEVSEIVSLGRNVMGARSLPGTLDVGDYAGLAPGSVDVAVSLQGFTHMFAQNNLTALGNVARALRSGGYLLMVDEISSPRLEAIEDALRRASLGLVAIGMVGGLGLTGWGVYPGLVLRKETQSVATVASAVDFMANEIWASFKKYCDATSEPDAQNTAYFHCEHEPLVVL